MQVDDWREERARATRLETARLLRGFEMYRAPPSQMINPLVEAYLYQKFGHGNITENAKCSWIRHCLTSYDLIQKAIHGKPGSGEMYHLVKAFACCAVIRRYDLRLTPIHATTAAGTEQPYILFRYLPDNLDAVERFIEERLAV